jgi:predicted MFS family arabinose efflux permease
MIIGALLYVLGLSFMANAHGFLNIMVGAGLLVGMSLACTAASVSMAVAARAVPTSIRSTMLGVVSAAGSLGSLIAAPLGQILSADYGWRAALVSFLVLSLALHPAAWFAGRVDKLSLPAPVSGQINDVAVTTAIKGALGHPSFLVMALLSWLDVATA